MAVRRQTLLTRAFTNEEKELEHMMFVNLPYTLTAIDVLKTLKSHIQRYKKFVYTTSEAIIDLIGSCIIRTQDRRKQKFMILFR